MLHPDINPTLSSCTWDWQLLKSCVPQIHQPGVKLCGTYKGMCHLSGSSKDVCRFPHTCEDTVLAVQGVVYEVAAVRVGPSTQTTENCPTPEGTVSPNRGKRIAKQQAATHGGPGSQNVTAGTAMVLDGTFTVHAGHALRFESGSHQFSLFTGAASEVQLEDAQG
jgi:hypothetical protein